MKRIILFLFSFVLLIPNSADAQVYADLGQTTVFSSSTTNGNRRALPVTMAEDGYIQSISIYHNGGGDASGMLLGVYSDVAGAPSTLLSVTLETSVNASSGWQTVDLTSQVSVTSGETVWLAWVFENNPGIRYQGGTPGRATSSGIWSDGMPSDFGSSTQANYVFSIYCTYIVASSVSTPVAPSGLSITDFSYYEVTIGWNDNSDNEDGFEIQRSTTSGTDFSTIHTTSSDITTYLDDTVLPGITYYYRVRAINAYGESSYTPEESVTTLALPILGNTEVFGASTTNGNRRAIPVTISETGDIESISIYHNGGGDASELILGVYSDVAGAPSTLLGATPVTAISASEGWQTLDLSVPITVSAGETVWLAWVFENNPGIRYQAGTPGRASSSGTWAGGMPADFGSSTQADYVFSIYCTYTLSSSGSAPADPTGLSITDATHYNVSLSWVDNSNDETGFEIQRSTTSGSDFSTIHTTSSDVTTYVDETVSPDVTYYYIVRAINSYGESSYTPEESVTTASVPSASATLGYTEAFGSATTNGNRRAIPVTMSETGDILSISIYHNGGGDASGLLLGVYSDLAGAPSTLLGATPVTAISASEGWQTVDLSVPVTVSAGETIWLAWVFENNPGIRYQAGTPGRANSSGVWAGGMPADFGSSTQADYIFSIYCSYALSSSGSAPLDPTGLSITDATHYNVSLSWVDNSNDETGFEIQRSTTSGSDFSTIHTTSSDVTSYVDETVSPDVTYYYIVRAINSYGESSYTPEESVTTASVPSASATLGYTEAFGSATTNGNRRAIPVSMSETGDILSISIYHNGGGDASGLLLGVYSDLAGAPSTLLGATPVTAISASEGWQTVDLSVPVTVSAGETKWLAWVFENNPGIRYQAGTPGRASSSGVWAGGMPADFGSSTQADYVFSIYCSYALSSSGSAPTAPSGFSSTDATYYSVSLSWVDNSNDETGFEIQRSTTSGSDFSTIYTTSSDVTTYVDETVSPDVTYYYIVRAINSYGESSYTPEESVTTPSIPTASATVGITEIFSSSTTNGNRQALPVTMSETGDILNISIYHNGGGDASGLILGVYSDVAGAPSTLLGATPVTAISATAGWQTVDLSVPVTVSAGETVWLAWVFENNPGIRFQAGTPGRASAGTGWTGEMPADFGSSTQANYEYSIYAGYAPAALKSITSVLEDEVPEEDKFLVYPNPTSGLVTVNWNYENEAGLILTIINSLGQVVEQMEIDPEKQETQLDLAGNKPGMYYLLFTDPVEKQIIHRLNLIKSQ